jgi:peptidoglycan L-alanyl-D-glutamate endopeptidase CwlK|tara:strand:+ start:643 stop:1050 length:408 start_codon:yes stop_codon:yes gene_type:complete
MPKFGKRSIRRLKGVDSRLRNVLNELIKIMDVTIIEGVRSTEKQQEYFKKGKSKIDGINKKGQHQLGKAVDLAPYPIDWNDRDRMHYMGGMLIGIGHSMGYKLRWGGDWDRDGETKDNNFDDLVHIEIRDEEKKG